MTTKFPFELDHFDNPQPDTSQSQVRTHSQQHGDANDAIEAIQAKVGINLSDDPESLDFKVGALQNVAEALDSAAFQPVSAFATSAQGEKADTAVQPDQLQATASELDGRIDDLEAAQASNAIYVGTWAELSSVAGTFVGQGAFVTTDPGTHTDPVSGATVSNAGQYRWTGSVWEWLRGDVLASKADKTEVVSLFDSNRYYRDITAETDYIDGYVMVSGGTVTTGNAGWRGEFVAVKAGDVVKYSGLAGTTSAGSYAIMIQLALDGSYVADLAAYTSTGSVLPAQEAIATATQDGFIYVRARTRYADGTLLLPVIYKRGALYVTQLEANLLQDNGTTTLRESLSNQYWRTLGSEAAYYGGWFMGLTGTITTGSVSWRGYKIPVKSGDVIRYTGPVGNTSTNASALPLALQLNTAGAFVGILYSFISTGIVRTGKTVTITATQDGFIWINARIASSTAITIEKSDSHSLDANRAGGQVTDYAYVDYAVIEKGGASITKAPASSQWKAVFIPVSSGDTVTYFGAHGSATAGEVMDYIMQLDSSFGYVSTLSQYTSLGTPTNYTYSTATATQDGYLYVRARYNDFKIYAKRARFAAAADVVNISRKIGVVASASPQMERLPVRLDNTWNYNATAFIQDQIVEAGGYQYVVVTAAGRLPHILQRSTVGGTWSVFDLSTVVDSTGASVLQSPTLEDGHCVAVVGVTKNGYILVAANMHGHRWRCVISNNPHDISSWSKGPQATTSTEVTYPRFVTYPDGTLQAFWREGSSGNGTYWSAVFDDATQAFLPKFKVIDAVGSNPYEQRIVVDDAGCLHLCWGYRTNSQNADTNYGMYYARSLDKGSTFTNAAGNAEYALPLSSTNSEKIYDAPAGSGYCNQNGACHDLNNRYHTVIWQYDKRGATQICHIWWDGAAWQSELVTDLDFSLTLSAATLDGLMSRPLICCSNIGRLYVVYHTTEMGREHDIRVVDVTTTGAPVDYCIAKYDVGTIELTINTDLVKRHGDLTMLVTRGASGAERSDYALYTSESAYLMTVNLPG